MIDNIFDSHAHYDDEQFDGDRDELLQSLPSKGVCAVINCASDLKSSASRCMRMLTKSSTSTDWQQRTPNKCSIYPETGFTVSGIRSQNHLTLF